MLHNLLRFLGGFERESCTHEWQITFVDRLTLTPRERQCRKCGATQRAEVIWVNVSRIPEKENRLVQ